MTPQPIEVDCGGYLATVSLDRATGDDAPVLRIEQDDTYVVFDATDLQPLIAALTTLQEAANDNAPV